MKKIIFLVIIILLGCSEQINHKISINCKKIILTVRDEPINSQSKSHSFSIYEIKQNEITFQKIVALINNNQTGWYKPIITPIESIIPIFEIKGEKFIFFSFSGKELVYKVDNNHNYLIKDFNEKELSFLLNYAKKHKPIEKR